VSDKHTRRTIVRGAAVLGIVGRLADINHVNGALVIAVSVVSMGEVIRIARFGNILLGLVLMAGPFLAEGATAGAMVNNVLGGLLILLLSFRRGRIRESYGLWSRYIF
jgi:hypothetical protein